MFVQESGRKKCVLACVCASQLVGNHHNMFQALNSKRLGLGADLRAG
jgi:hypothetical protein